MSPSAFYEVVSYIRSFIGFSWFLITYRCVTNLLLNLLIPADWFLVNLS